MAARRPGLSLPAFLPCMHHPLKNLSGLFFLFPFRFAPTLDGVDGKWPFLLYAGMMEAKKPWRSSPICLLGPVLLGG